MGDFLYTQHRTVKSDAKLSFVSRILQHEPLVLVVTGTFIPTVSLDVNDQYKQLETLANNWHCKGIKENKQLFTLGATQDQKEIFLGTISKMDVIQFVSEKNPAWEFSPRWKC